MNTNDTLISKTTSSGAVTSFYLRQSLDDTGKPSFGLPLERCPDIIQSDCKVADPQQDLGTEESWGKSYDVAPVFEVENYYYVRAKNTAADQGSGSLSLYWTPAQVFMLPNLWGDNRMLTADGSDRVQISADATKIAVTQPAFEWKPKSDILPSDSYVSFVAQYNAEENSDSLPSVKEWRDLAKLIGSNHSLGIRNQAVVWGIEWVRRQQLVVPDSFADTSIYIIVTAHGLAGTKFGLHADTMANPDIPHLTLGPCDVPGDGEIVGRQFSLPPGYRTNLAVQFWNYHGVMIEPGSTLQVVFAYPKDAQDVIEAMEQGLVNQYLPVEDPSGGTKPKPLCVVGELCFTFVDPPPASESE